VTMEIQQLCWKLEELATTFRAAVFEQGDVEAALACLTEDCPLTNVPTGTGGTGTDELRRHLTEDVVPHRPADLAFRRVSRTTDQRRMVDECVVSFTHDRPLPWLLPGAEPTGRRAEVLAISVVGVRHRSRGGRTTSLISAYRTLWDHAGMLAQLGLAPTMAAPAGR
jgi:carboxymethylenebutenolidase